MTLRIIAYQHGFKIISDFIIKISMITSSGIASKLGYYVVLRKKLRT